MSDDLPILPRKASVGRGRHAMPGQGLVGPMSVLMDEMSADVDLQILQIKEPVQALMDEGCAGEDANNGLVVEGVSIHGLGRLEVRLG